MYIIKYIIPPSLDSSHPVFLPFFTPTKTARKAAECNDLRQLNAEAPDRQRQLFIEAVLENLTKNGDFMEVFMWFLLVLSFNMILIWVLNILYVFWMVFELVLYVFESNTCFWYVCCGVSKLRSWNGIYMCCFLMFIWYIYI